MKHSLKHLSVMLLCLMMLLAMAACNQTDTEDDTMASGIEFVGIEEYEVKPGYTVKNYTALRGPQPYFGVVGGSYLTNRGQVFVFGIRDSNPNTGTTRIHDEGYVPALFLRAVVSKGDTIYVLSFEGSNDQQELLAFAAEYIDTNYDLEEGEQ